MADMNADLINDLRTENKELRRVNIKLRKKIEKQRKTNAERDARIAYMRTEMDIALENFEESADKQKAGLKILTKAWSNQGWTEQQAIRDT